MRVCLEEEELLMQCELWFGELLSELNCDWVSQAVIGLAAQ